MADQQPSHSVVLGVPVFIDLIRQGKIVASGMQQPFQMGGESAKAMLDYLDGKKPPKEILVPIIVVSQKNLDELLPTIERTVSLTSLRNSRVQKCKWSRGAPRPLVKAKPSSARNGKASKLFSPERSFGDQQVLRCAFPATYCGRPQARDRI